MVMSGVIVFPTKRTILIVVGYLHGLFNRTCSVRWSFGVLGRGVETLNVRLRYTGRGGVNHV